MTLNDFKHKVLENAHNKGFSSGEVYIKKGDNFSVTVLNGQVAQYEVSSEQGIAFRGEYNKNMGYAYSESTDEYAADFIVNISAENSQLFDQSHEEIYHGEKNYPNINLYNEKVDEITEDMFINAALEMEKSALEYDSKISAVDYCLIGYGKELTSLANTNNIDKEYKANNITAYISVIAKYNDDIKTAGEYWTGNDWTNFNPKKLGEKAAEKAVSRFGAESVKSGKYDVILNNEVMSDILATFCGVFFGENVEKGFSLLKDKKGQLIASEILNLKDDGLLENGLGSAPLDSEGVACKNKTVIENGVLKTYLHNLKSAKKMNEPITGNGFRPSFKSPVITSCTNFYIENGNKQPEEIYSIVKDGILITDVQGLHSGTNTISGDFSLSAEGYLIENGKITKPVEQITIADNFYNVLKNVKEIGNDLRFSMPSGKGVFGSPMVYVGKMAVSGQ